MIRVGIVIPDRGDRPEFMDNCLDMMNRQTLQPHITRIIDYKPVSDKVDITPRYRMGYEVMTAELKLSARRVDLIAFIENDDWYSPQYLEYMVEQWKKNNCPNLFGTNYTIYYHLKLRKYFTFRHIQRASAMNTFIRPGLKFEWPADHDPYTDQWLWLRAEIPNKLSIEPEYIISVGMKHGIGKVGGEFHDSSLSRFINEDDGFLKNNLDPESYKFYTTIDFSK